METASRPATAAMANFMAVGGVGEALGVLGDRACVRGEEKKKT